MSGNRFVKTSVKTYMITTQVLGYASCAASLALKYTGHFSNASYIVLACVLPFLVCFTNFFPLLNSYVDRTGDTSTYFLTGTCVALVVFFIIASFLAR